MITCLHMPCKIVQMQRQQNIDRTFEDKKHILSTLITSTISTVLFWWQCVVHSFSIKKYHYCTRHDVIRNTTHSHLSEDIFLRFPDGMAIRSIGERREISSAGWECTTPHQTVPNDSSRSCHVQVHGLICIHMYPRPFNHFNSTIYSKLYMAYMHLKYLVFIHKKLWSLLECTRSLFLELMHIL